MPLADTYRMAFTIVAGLQACSSAWFLWSDRRVAVRLKAFP